MSSTVSERSTYTRARDSSAPLISNDGFSVVAPMKQTVPSSTYGRKASCCALLKRCTSSRKSTVRRPLPARICCACSTAARTSFTPAITADSARNSESQVFATRRASVVLPVPGGPHRIIECRLRPSSKRRSGLPGASRCDWPMNSSRLAGRMRSASGRKGVTSATTRSVASSHRSTARPATVLPRRRRYSPPCRKRRRCDQPA